MAHFYKKIPFVSSKITKSKEVGASRINNTVYNKKQKATKTFKMYNFAKNIISYFRCSTSAEIVRLTFGGR